MQTLLFATHNQHKIRELAQLLGPEFAVLDLSTFKDAPVIAETGETFAVNATLKAVGVSAGTSELVVADDSGLEVDALNGAPGVYSARFAGEGSTDAANVQKLLTALGAATARSARFRCVLAVARLGNLIGLYEGTVEGVIAGAPRGNSGFGYDPVFIPHGMDKTFAEMSADAKNQLSHRAKAVAALKSALLNGSLA